MENETIIKVKNIGKKYNIAHQQGGYVALRDVLANILKSPFKFLRHKTKKIVGIEKNEEFWALRGIDFEVKKGEVVGIIGRNGAGKSTLLKILSQITPPTEGEIEINGRIGSLLEVGTGFHPELSGRENIFLNGAILGMTKKEISEKFDEIVAFAGIEQFLDTPVKRYSSGMYVRLAFSVAAHMNPDILIIDEVLAVGDAEFQKKCLNKMNDITQKEGRTILFVSHNMEAIERLCTRCILLNKGKIQTSGDDVKGILKEYALGTDKTANSTKWINTENKFDNPFWKPLQIYLTDEFGQRIEKPLSVKNKVWLNIEGEVSETNKDLTIGYALYNESNTPIYWSYQKDYDENNWPKIEKGHCHIKSKIPLEILSNGLYRVELIGGIHGHKWIFKPYDDNPRLNFTLQGISSDSPYWKTDRPTILSPKIKWEN